MLNNLENYCSSIKLDVYESIENTLSYKGVIDNKNFTLCVEGNEVRISTADDLLFTSLCTVLQAKYKSLLTVKRNVTLLGRSRPYNLVQFSCRKESKIKVILGQVERIYFDLKKEKELEKVGKN